MACQRGRGRGLVASPERLEMVGKEDVVRSQNAINKENKIEM